jgi:hypothetical protein
MKHPKKRPTTPSKGQTVKESLLDALGELIFYLIFFGIGFLVLTLLGTKDADIDPDFAVLIGLLAVFLIGGTIALAIFLVKKKKPSDPQNSDNSTPPTLESSNGGSQHDHHA